MQDNQTLIECVHKHFSGRMKTPVLAFVGKKEKIVECFVAVSRDVMYSTASIVDAIDIFMKISIICKKAYNSAAAPVWTYLQKFVYEINDPTDKFLSVLELHDKISAYKVQNHENE